jgi:type VI secretion system protein ImpM
LIAWYGKLPSLGDFASRRLEPHLLEVLDEWLASGLAAWQAHDPEGWLAQYLASPCWRFAAMPGGLAKGEGAQVGVMMPSLDRVGRYFPFVLLHPAQSLPANEVELRELLAWLHELDDLAVDALQEDWPVDPLEEALAAAAGKVPGWMTSPVPAIAGGTWDPDARPGWQAVAPGNDLAAALAASVRAGWQRHLQGQVWWWCVDAQGQHRLWATDGLPRGAAFIELMSPLAMGAGRAMP